VDSLHQKRRRTELAAPLTDGFVADNDAAGGQDLLDLPIAQREAEVEPHGVSNNLGWRPMAFVGGGRGGRHAPIIPRRRNPATRPFKLTIPYQELGTEYLQRRNPTAQAKRLMAQIEKLGYTVTLEPGAAA
jgi:hypothetical protein